jgi:predicted NUDIX family phosphoesterase
MEFVYVVPRSDLFPEYTPHGFLPFRDAEQGAADVVQSGSDAGIDRRAFMKVVRSRGFYVEREIAETTPAWKQVIPYVVVYRTKASGEAEVFLLRRTKGGGEKRLHDKLSIGVGGHINPIDSSVDSQDVSATVHSSESSSAGHSSASDDSDGCALRPNPIPAACRRELHEELIVPDNLRPLGVGLLNDDTNPVGAVHVGLVEIVHVDGPVTVRETDQLEGSFTALSDLESMVTSGANLETWSALLISSLPLLLATGQDRVSSDSQEFEAGRGVLDSAGASN